MSEEEQSIPSEFVVELFRLAIHNQYIQQIVTSNIKQNWLGQQFEKDFLTELKFQVEVESKKPTFGTLLLGAKSNKNKELQEYIGVIRDAELRDPNTIIKSIEDFIRQAMFIEMYDESAAYYNKKQRNKAYKVMSDGIEKLDSFSLTTDMFEPVFGNFPQRNIDRIVENSRGYVKLPTGIDELDYKLGGGPERKELMCLLADSKGGKSFALTHLGVNYARRGIGVAHFQLEGTKKQCNNRYDSNWSGSLYSDIKSGTLKEEKFKSYKKIVENIGKGEIWVHAPEKFGNMNVLELRRMIIDLKKKHDIEVIIIDYVDLLNPDEQIYRLSDERHRQEMTMRKLKELAMELDVLVITATQASSIDAELLQEADFVLKREHLAEAKGKVRPVDYLISINRTNEEKRQGICRLYLEAIREYAAEITITIAQNLPRSRFYDRKKTVGMGLWEQAEEAA